MGRGRGQRYVHVLCGHGWMDALADSGVWGNEQQPRRGRKRKEERLQPCEAKRTHGPEGEREGQKWLCRAHPLIPHILACRRILLSCCACCSCKISRCSWNTCRALSSTISKPSLPFAAFCWKRSTLNCSMLFLIFCQPPHKAVISALWVKAVLSLGDEATGWYMHVSRTLRRSDHVMFMEQRVSFLATGST